MKGKRKLKGIFKVESKSRDFFVLRIPNRTPENHERSGLLVGRRKRDRLEELTPNDLVNSAGWS